MTPTPGRPDTINPARRYQDFLAEMYERFKHDDGHDIEEWEEVQAPSYFNFVRFRSEDDLKYYDPRRPEFWHRRVIDSSEKPQDTEGSTPYIPPDPLSDDNFKRIQQEICTEPSHGSLLEQSIQRCELPDEEHEKEAEDIPSIEDSEVFKKEIELLCKAFENHLSGNVDDSDVDDGLDENEVAQRRQDTQNILEVLDKTVVPEETIVDDPNETVEPEVTIIEVPSVHESEELEDDCKVSEIRDFRPRKSSTFLIPNLDESHDETEKSDVENPNIIIEAATMEEIEEGDETEEDDSSAFLRLRVSGTELDSVSSSDSGSSDSTATDDRNLLTAPGKCTPVHATVGSDVTPKKQHPPLHLLTPLQRRLVKLDLY